MEVEEEWRMISGFEGLYEVSSEGRVRSLYRIVVDTGSGRTRLFKGKILSDICSNTGYHCVSLHRNSKRVTRKQVQRIVAEAFLGPPAEEGMYVDHRNGIRSDNRVENLRWVYPHVNNNNTPYTRYLRALLEEKGIAFMTEEDFHESRIN